MGQGIDKKDPTVWRAKVLFLYRKVIQLQQENRFLKREVNRLNKKIKRIQKREKRKQFFLAWVRKIFCFKNHKNG